MGRHADDARWSARDSVRCCCTTPPSADEVLAYLLRAPPALSWMHVGRDGRATFGSVTIDDRSSTDGTVTVRHCLGGGDTTAYDESWYEMGVVPGAHARTVYDVEPRDAAGAIASAVREVLGESLQLASTAYADDVDDASLLPVNNRRRLGAEGDDVDPSRHYEAPPYALYDLDLVQAVLDRRACTDARRRCALAYGGTAVRLAATMDGGGGSAEFIERVTRQMNDISATLV